MLIENIIRKKSKINKMIVYAEAYNNLQTFTLPKLASVFVGKIEPFYKRKTPRI